MGAAEYEARTSSVIPDAARGWERAIDDYFASPPLRLPCSKLIMSRPLLQI